MSGREDSLQPKCSQMSSVHSGFSLSVTFLYDRTGTEEAKESLLTPTGARTGQERAPGNKPDKSSSKSMKCDQTVEGVLNDDVFIRNIFLKHLFILTELNH